MKKYSIRIQFANPNAPDFLKIHKVIKNAIDFYNQKSLIASNPKSIIDHHILDPCTLELVLESEAELPYPGKALQTFSRYLVDPDTDGSLYRFIYSKQLFKMSCEEISEQKTANSDANEELASMRVRAISLILNISKEKLGKFIEFLEEEQI